MRLRIASLGAVCAVLVIAALAGWLRPLDDALTDARFALAGRAGSGSIVIVDIDSKSLAAIGRWPLPRRLYADAIDRLVGLGAAEIAFDIDFSAASTPEDDAALESALARAGDSVILAAFDQPLTAGGTVGGNRPIERFARHAWLANVNVPLDPDGKVRRFADGSGSGADLTPSLAALYGGGSALSRHEFRIDFGIDAAAIDRLSLVDLLDGQIDKRRVAGKKIIIGGQAIELRDDFLVPRYGVVSGSLLQALGAETVAAGRSLSRTNRLVAAVGLLAIALLAFSLWYRRWQTRLAVIGATALALEAIAVLIQRAWPLEVATGAWQAALFAFAVLALLREIDVRRILVAISRSETANTQTILGRVIADSYAGVLVFDADGTVVAASRRAGAILGQTKELTGAGIDVLPRELAAILSRIREAARSGEPHRGDSGEITCPRGSEDVVLEYVATPSRLDGGLDRDGGKRPDSNVVCLTFMDVTERRRAADRIAYLARFDMLTGLANRHQLIERLNLALDHYRHAGVASAVVSLDVDRFKAINDALGQNMGDRLLSAIAARIKAMTRPDDLVARVAGDDFAVVLLGAEAVRAKDLALRLIADGAHPYDVESHRLIAGMSAGIALLAAGDTDPFAVLQRADTALARAKATGGNGVEVFDAAMASGIAAGQRLEQELWDAFRRKEFEVFYQPVVELATGRITGCEALLRWRHPVRGLVAAAEFVPVLETIGLMPAVGRFVLETASAAAATWPAYVRVAVNVSSVQFMRGNLVESVVEALGDAGLPAARLTLEITESLFLQATHAVRETMDALVAIGVDFALDDFGTGYSSLAYLRNFPVSTIKIDRSFVVGLPRSEEAVAIVRAILVLAESLGMGVVAEGIDTIDQVCFLRLLGCLAGQGYLYGAAMPVHEFAALLEDRSQRRAAS